jgi:ketosteroid isomerase-like protein
MSQENVEMVRAMFTAIAGLDLVIFFRDTDPAQLRALTAAAYDPEIEVVWVDTSPDSGPYHGHEGAIQSMIDWTESFEEFHFEPTEFIDAGDDVVVPNRQYGIGKGSGAKVEMTAAWVCTVKDGKIARLLEYSSKANALEAAGLSE